MMTKKDFELMAQVIASSKTGKKDNQVILLKEFIPKLCVIFKVNNPWFNKDKFIDACNVPIIFDDED